MRSETLVLLPSQWSCMPVFAALQEDRGEIDDADALALAAAGREFQFSSALAGLKVSKRPGPKVGSLWTKSSKRSTIASSRSRTRPMPTKRSASRLTRSTSTPLASIWARKRSALKRSSTAARGEEALEGREVDGVRRHARQRRQACRPASARTLPAWQPAQLRKMRSSPMVLRSEVPTGRGWRSSGGRSAGSSVMKPKAAQPSSSRPGGHQVAEQRRHRLPHGVGDAEVAVAAGRAVFELGDRVGEGLGLVAGQPPGEVAAGARGRRRSRRG